MKTRGIGAIIVFACTLVGCSDTMPEADRYGHACAFISAFAVAVEVYFEEEESYPGEGLSLKVDRNDFPVLFDALMGAPKPEGLGGRSAPYINIRRKGIAVWDFTEKTYRKATTAEIEDVRRSKFVLDPWGNPYVYRANRGGVAGEWMHNSETFDLYSLGPNGVDDTAAGNRDGDDFGNW